MFYLSLLRRNHYEKVLTTELQLTLKLLDEGRIFSGIVPRQERGSFVCKHRQTEEAKTTIYIFFYKTSFFESYTATQYEAIKK